MNFWSNYWWLILIIILVILFVLFLLRWYQFHHIDYRWEQKRHFPQWSNSGIITRDNYLLRTNYNFIEDSKCIVIGVHGMGGAKEDFNRTKEFLNKHQISFLSFDQRNWGENSKWKYHSLGTTVIDIEDIISVLIERYPNQKIFLLGESFGSALAAIAFKRLDNQLAGAILTNFVTRNQIFKITGNSVAKVIIGFLFYKNILLPVNYDPEDFSDDIDYIDAVNERNYRRNNKSFTLLYLMQTKKITKQIVKNINNDSISPVLVLQTGEDVLADMDKVQENEKKWRKEVTYKYYKKGKHAILNDSHTETVLKDINKWISSIK